MMKRDAIEVGVSKHPDNSTRLDCSPETNLSWERAGGVQRRGCPWRPAGDTCRCRDDHAACSGYTCNEITTAI